MKITKKHIRVAGYVSTGMASCAILILCVVRVFGVCEYTVLVDRRVAPTARIALAAYMQALPRGVRVAQRDAVREIKELFPWVHSVSMRRLPSNVMSVRVAAAEPIVKVNDIVITQTQRIIPADIFDADGITHIPHSTVIFEQDGQLPELFIPHAKTLASNLFSSYSLTWIDEYQARLTDTEQPRFVILFNAYSIPDASMLAHCASIKKQLEERGSFGGRHKTTRWVADIRFDHQVVVFSEKGGMRHG